MYIVAVGDSWIEQDIHYYYPVYETATNVAVGLHANDIGFRIYIYLKVE